MRGLDLKGANYQDLVAQSSEDLALRREGAILDAAVRDELLRKGERCA